MTATAADNMMLAAGEVELRAGDGKSPPRAEILAYSGGLMRVPDWGDVVIDLAGIDISAQVVLLADHHSDVGNVVGHGRGEVRNGRLHVSGVISGRGDAARQIVELARSGLAFGASVGVSVAEHEVIRAGQKVNVNGRTVSSPRAFTLVRKGKLREVSITALAADADTSVAIAASRKENPMDTEVQNAGEEAIRADERERLKNIEAVCRPPGSGWGKAQDRVNELKAAAIAGEIEVKDLTAELLTILRDSRPKLRGVYSPGPMVSDVSVLEAALLRRMGLEALGEQALGALAMEHGASLRATHALDLCRAALNLEGREVPHGREEMVRAALSTYALPTALGNVANKLLLDAYTESPATWRSFAAIRSASNFHEHTAIRPSFAGALQPVAPGGELKHGSATEWTAQFKVDTFGKLLSIDRRDLVNDDLSIFDQTARAFGRAAMRALADLVYQVLLANAGGFFSEANGNYLVGVDTALSVEGLSKAITAMLTQRDDEDNDLDLRPATLVVPPELQTAARAVLESEYITTSPGQPTGNSVKKAVALEVEPRLSNTAKFGSAASPRAWYLFASPGATPMIAAFLNGQQSPTFEFFGLDQDVNRLAASWRVYFDYGAALVDPRAAVRAKGEA